MIEKKKDIDGEVQKLGNVSHYPKYEANQIRSFP